MELFDKVYNCYYQIIFNILKEGSAHPLTRQDLQRITDTYGYEESAITIIPKLINFHWPLLHKTTDNNWTGGLDHLVKTPVTQLQKSWLKALLSDPRIRLFFSADQLASLENSLTGVAPLYQQSDFYYFDRYQDGDDYDSPIYQACFQTILAALNEERFLLVSYTGKRHAEPSIYEVYPCHLQYSPKDDKFRLYGFWQKESGRLIPIILNLNRLLDCHLSRRNKPARLPQLKQQQDDPVLIEISGERNSLERCMLHFANYEKHTEYDEDKKVYYCSIFYNIEDETELLIQLLSFGPVIRILGPDRFLRLVRERTNKQHELFHRPVY